MTPDAYDVKAKIGVIFQEVAIFEELTVYENIDYFCGLYIKDKKTRKQYIEEAIELVGIGEFKKFYPKQLSGGLLRRLNIACGIAHKPKLIFLDEPTVAVDPQSRNNILDGIKKLRDNGATIVYTTHYMEEAEILCNRIIILDKGKIIASGSSDELKKKANIEEKITVEIQEIDNSKIEEIKKFENVENVNFNMNTLVVTYKKGKNNLGELIDYLKDNKVTYSKIFSERPTLNDVFLELTGNKDTKPFDCVGTFEEVNFAVSKVITDLERKHQTLPYLLQYYREYFSLADMTEDITKRYNEENHLTKEQNEWLRQEFER